MKSKKKICTRDFFYDSLIPDVDTLFEYRKHTKIGGLLELSDRFYAEFNMMQMILVVGIFEKGGRFD